MFIVHLHLRCKRSILIASNGSLFSLRHLARCFGWTLILIAMSLLLVSNAYTIAQKPSPPKLVEAKHRLFLGSGIQRPKEDAGSHPFSINTEFQWSRFPLQLEADKVRDPEFWTWPPKPTFTLKNACTRLTRQPAGCRNSCPLYSYKQELFHCDGVHAFWSCWVSGTMFKHFQTPTLHVQAEETESQIVYPTLARWVSSQWNADQRDWNGGRATIIWNIIAHRGALRCYSIVIRFDRWRKKERSGNNRTTS